LGAAAVAQPGGSGSSASAPALLRDELGTASSSSCSSGSDYKQHYHSTTPINYYQYYYFEPTNTQLTGRNIVIKANRPQRRLLSGESAVERPHSTLVTTTNF